MPHTDHTPPVSAAHSMAAHSTWYLSALAALGFVLTWGPANAQTAAPSTAASSAPAVADSQELSEGEVTRWDARSQKITLRHGELKNLGMPPMTMVFTVQGAAPASEFKRGDKVRFRAEQVNGVFVVTHLEAVN